MMPPGDQSGRARSSSVDTTPPTVAGFISEWGFLLGEPSAPAAREIARIDVYWHEENAWGGQGHGRHRACR